MLTSLERRRQRQPIDIPERRNQRPALRIALVNNMPDAALRATERHFVDAIQNASAGLTLNLRLFTLPGVERGAEASAHIARHYEDFDALMRTTFDAVIVTGAEPRSCKQEDEEYWPQMAQLIEWSSASTNASLWSCLAAHAAVLQLSGIRRRPLLEKVSGIFECEAIRLDPLCVGTTAKVAVPHSRRNTLDRAELEAGDYTILRASEEIGVDLFTLERGSRYVFMQGHPEYATDTLLREYRRDVGRFLRGERPDYPAEPAHYFSAEALAVLRAYGRRCALQRDPTLLDVFPDVTTPNAITNRWQRPTAVFYRNWLDSLSARSQTTSAVA